ICKKYALLKKTKQPTSSSPLPELRAHDYCTTTATAVPLLLSAADVWPVRTANNAAIRACTLRLYLHCCMYTYRRECTTPTKLSLPRATALPRVTHGLTMSQGRILE
ncbi:unnamed protein product, partial [Ascophyllum nodosum]